MENSVAELGRAPAGGEDRLLTAAESLGIRPRPVAERVARLDVDVGRAVVNHGNLCIDREAWSALMPRVGDLIEVWLSPDGRLDDDAPKRWGVFRTVCTAKMATSAMLAVPKLVLLQLQLRIGDFLELRVRAYTMPPDPQDGALLVYSRLRRERLITHPAQ